MTRYASLPPDPRAREKAEAMAHAAGRMGATRVPDEVLVIAGLDASDTAVYAILQALEAGQLERLQS